MAAALQISRVQSNKCWFLTTGNIFAVTDPNRLLWRGFNHNTTDTLKFKRISIMKIMGSSEVQRSKSCLPLNLNSEKNRFFKFFP